MASRVKKYIWIFASLIIASFLVFLAYSKRGQPTAPQLVYAPVGQLVSGFSRELILDGNASVKQSYSVDYQKQNLAQKTANFTSGLSLAELFNKYKQYFRNDGWAIREDVYPKTQGIYAKKGSGTASVVIVDTGALREVQVSNIGSLK